MINKVTIIGVGLIGGSLGLAIKKRKLAKLVIGVARRKESAIKAVAYRAVDVATLNLAEGVKDADLVILCVPVSTITRQLREIKPFLSKKALVMDVGSTKGEIEKAAKKFLKGFNFVGAHPMAGSEKTGVEFSDADLFKDSVCFLTSENASAKKFWQSLGAKSVTISAKEHDQWVARASHLPHLIAFSFFQNFKAQKFPMNPSLREIARLAKSDPELWTDIFISNREALLKAVSQLEKYISTAKKFLRRADKAKLVRFIANANRTSSCE